MTLDEAIEMLERIVAQDEESGRPDCAKAERLGIKALERIKGLRSAGHYIGMPLLKGETEE